MSMLVDSSLRSQESCFLVKSAFEWLSTGTSSLDNRKQVLSYIFLSNKWNQRCREFAVVHTCMGTHRYDNKVAKSLLFPNLLYQALWCLLIPTENRSTDTLYQSKHVQSCRANSMEADSESPNTHVQLWFAISRDKITSKRWFIWSL